MSQNSIDLGCTYSLPRTIIQQPSGTIWAQFELQSACTLFEGTKMADNYFPVLRNHPRRQGLIKALDWVVVRLSKWVPRAGLGEE